MISRNIDMRMIRQTHRNPNAGLSATDSSHRPNQNSDYLGKRLVLEQVSVLLRRKFVSFATHMSMDCMLQNQDYFPTQTLNSY